MRPTYKNLSIAVLVLLGLTLSQSGRAADVKQQTWRQKPQAVQSQQDAVPTNPTHAMDCVFCTSTTVVVKRDLVAGKSGHGFKEVTTTVHQCPTCRDTLARNAGAKEFAWTHTCRAENELPTCCDTMRLSGRGA